MKGSPGGDSVSYDGVCKYRELLSDIQGRPDRDRGMLNIYSCNQ